MEDIMRDKKRIRAFCNRLADAWEQCPDLRFGQFMMNVFGRMGKDPFFPEDDEMIRCIEQFVEENYRVILRTHGKRGDGSD
jgi:hypothetical protein